jgi:outer membrane protein OmpA-like peptidoglycan-associated protein
MLSVGDDNPELFGFSHYPVLLLTVKPALSRRQSPHAKASGKIYARRRNTALTWINTTIGAFVEDPGRQKKEVDSQACIWSRTGGALLLAACSSSPALTSTSTAALASSKTIVPGSEEDLASNVGDRVLFDFDKASLKPDATATLDKQAAWFARYPQNRARYPEIPTSVAPKNTIWCSVSGERTQRATIS